MRCENWKARASQTPASGAIVSARAFWVYAISSSLGDEKGVPVGPVQLVIMYFSFASSNAYVCTILKATCANVFLNAYVTFNFYTCNCSISNSIKKKTVLSSYFINKT